MKYGIISDIHGNLDALDAVLDRLGNVDEIICPGDIVGYGPDPNECCRKLRSLRRPVVIGNHDAAITGLMDLSWFNPAAYEAALWTRDTLDEDNLRYLSSLPAKYSTEEFLLVHASLNNPMEFHYILSPSMARPCFEEMSDYTLCFIGHTHISEIFVQRIGENGVDELFFTRGGKFDLRSGFRYIVNCGSVGQPRDGNKDAACGIFDSEANSIEIIRVPYDIGAVQARMRGAGLPQSLVSRLDCGE